MAISVDQHLCIPVIDFTPARTGSEEDRRRVAKELYEAFKNVGFAYVKNHGVPQDAVDEAFVWVCRDPHPLSDMLRRVAGWGGY